MCYSASMTAKKTLSRSGVTIFPTAVCLPDLKPKTKNLVAKCPTPVQQKPGQNLPR